MRISTAQTAAIAAMTLTLMCTSIASAGTPGGSEHSPARQWSTAAPMPYSLQEVGSTILGDYLYVAGGLGIPGQSDIFSNKHVRMNLTTGKWEDLADLPVAAHHLQGFAVGDKVIYLGGEEGAALVANGRTWEYDPSVDRFTELAPMPAGRVRGATGAALYDGKIYVAGGAKVMNFGERQFDVFDPVANTWLPLADLPRAREHLGGAVVNGKFYVVGGRNLLPTGYVTATDVYDIAGNTWEQPVADIPSGRGGLGVVAVGSNIYAFGGEGPGISFDDAEVLDTTAGTWRELSPMPKARHGIQAAEKDGAIYLAGGAFIGIYGPAADVQVFRP